MEYPPVDFLFISPSNYDGRSPSMAIINKNMTMTEWSVQGRPSNPVCVMRYFSELTATCSCVLRGTLSNKMEVMINNWLYLWILSVLFCSFKDLCEGSLKEVHRGTSRSRTASPAVPTTSGSVWTPVEWTPLITTRLYPILCKGARLSACRGSLTRCLTCRGQTCSTWRWRKWKKSR